MRHQAAASIPELPLFCSLVYLIMFWFLRAVIRVAEDAAAAVAGREKTELCHVVESRMRLPLQLIKWISMGMVMLRRTWEMLQKYKYSAKNFAL